MKTIKTSEDLFDVLSNVRNELTKIKGLRSIRCDKSLYAFIFSAAFNVSCAISHLDEFEEV